MDVWFVRLARIGAGLALVVVMLGAWVRLTDAGLGCPDWPGCYGRIVVPDAATSPADLGLEFSRPLEAGKAWREMIHRYLASTLGLVCVSLATEPVNLARLKGLTFATLESSFIARSERSQGLFRVHLVSTIVLALFVIGLWVHFA